jgi:CubicO group peptidase (beta-lactamase class C family)
VDDLARWDEALTGAALVSRASLERAWTPYRLADGSSTHYGYGWSLETLDGQAWIGHGGGIPGFVCYILRVPAEELFVTVLSNVIGPGPSPETIVFKLARIACGRPVPEPKPVQAPLEVLERIAGKYVDMDGDESAFRLIDGRLLWGEAQGEGGSETEMVSETALILKSMPLCVVQFTLDPDGKVTGFTMTNQYGRVSLTATRKED